MRGRLGCRPRCIRSRSPMAEAHLARGPDRPPALAGLRFLYATAWATDRMALAASLVLRLAGSLLSPLYPLGFKLLVDGAQSGDDAKVAWAAALIIVSQVLSLVCFSYAAIFGWNVWERMTVTLDAELVAVTTRIGLVDRVEDPEYLEHLTLVRTGREHFQESMMSLEGAVFLSLQLLVTAALLAFVAPVLLLLPVFGVAPVLSSRWAERRSQRAQEESALDAREADGFALLAVEAQAAGELRVLRLDDLLIDRQRSAWERLVARQWKAEWVGATVSTLALMVFTLGFGAAILLITVQALHGSATIGS